MFESMVSEGNIIYKYISSLVVRTVLIFVLCSVYFSTGTSQRRWLAVSAQTGLYSGYRRELSSLVASDQSKREIETSLLLLDACTPSNRSERCDARGKRYLYPKLLQVSTLIISSLWFNGRGRIIDTSRIMPDRSSIHWTHRFLDFSLLGC